MTTQDIINYYSGLLILQYFTKPKAIATIQAIVGPVIMDQLPIAVQNAYDLNSAVGVQLDVLGKYAGVSREGYIFSGPVVLGDADFRTLIKLAIVQNNGGSSLADIQKLISIYFPGTLLIFDFKDMRIGYFFDSSVGSDTLAQFIVKQGLLPKPMGVQLGTVVYAANINNFFGFRTYELPGFNVAPFNSYSDYKSGCPWLSYQDQVGG
jgi:hypothetical protein